MTAGSFAAHALAYRIIEPDSVQRAHHLAATGHGYLAYAPAALAGCLALLFVALLGQTVQSIRRPAPARVSWHVALVPLLGFALQEHLERLVAGGDAPVATILEPTFLVGLALQLPFALAALVVARALVRTAEVIGSTLVQGVPRQVRAAPDVFVNITASLPRVRPLAFGTSGRGPPRER